MSERIEQLEEDLLRLEHSKLELIRATSTEIERLRTIIRVLMGCDTVETLGTLSHEPMLFGPVRSALEKGRDSVEMESKKDTLEAFGTTPGGDFDSDEEDEDEKDNSLDELEDGDEERDQVTDDLKLQDKSSSTLRRSYKKDVTFRLSSQRMSHTGFEFSDFGFMTTDFEQLSRGHSSWVNEVRHHPVQNGICLSASDDWSVMFWRFQKTSEAEVVEQEKVDALAKQLSLKSRGGAPLSGLALTRLEQRVHRSQFQLKIPHLTGEIALYPLLKINTGLEVKAIELSKEGNVLACTCFDDEEDEGNPELQLYYDESYQWQFHDDELLNTEERVVKRHIIPLEFEPAPRSLCVTQDGRRVFLSMISSKSRLEQMREEIEDDSDSEDGFVAVLPSAPCTLVVVDTVTRMVTKCRKINEVMCNEEYVTATAISPGGTRIAIGTSLGRLIVCGTRALTNPESVLTEKEQKWWISNEAEFDALSTVETHLTSICWSPDGVNVVTGHGNGRIVIWRKKEERRMTQHTKQAISKLMSKLKRKRRQVLFAKAWEIADVHLEAVNSISLSGSLMISGSDDGIVVLHDMYDCFTCELGVMNESVAQENKPLVIGRVDKIHQGRMVNSVSLCTDYNEADNLIPTTGAFMVTSGADNVLHCISTSDVIRQSYREKLKAVEAK